MNTANIMEEIEKNKIYNSSTLQLSGIPQVQAGNTENEATQDESGVTLEISDEGKQKLAESQKNEQDQKLTDMDMFHMQMEKMREDSEKAEEYADDTAKIMTIFRRIANGDIVPTKDENKLMEYSMEMYQAAKNLGSIIQNEDRKKYKSVDEEDEEDSEAAISKEEAIRALTDSHSSVSVNIKSSGVE